MNNYIKQKGLSQGIIIGIVAAAVIIVVIVLFVTSRGPETNQPEPAPSSNSGINTELEEELGIFPVRITQLPAEAKRGTPLEVVWLVSPADVQTIDHTAIHWDVASHSGELGTNTTVADSGYPNITPEYASGEFSVPNEFSTRINVPDYADTIYLRAHAVINDENFWTEEVKLPVTGDSMDIGSASGQTVTIAYSADGFAPEEVFIIVGDTVRFINNSDRSFWPATDVHPTHKVYPGSDIKLCGTEDADKIFDACGPVVRGGTYTFTFDEVGDWQYHDHLRSSLGGVIHVE